MPYAVAEVVPDASHDLVNWRPDELADRIVAFAAKASAQA
jgi:hypothetical protein